MKKNLLTLGLILGFTIFLYSYNIIRSEIKSYVRINLLGYQPSSIKIAVWGSKGASNISSFDLVDVATGKIVFKGNAGKPFGAYGPFIQTYRLDFSAFKKPGKYLIRAGSGSSPEFTIGEDVYKGSAEFCLRYMRQQRTGFNPFLNDSCHTHDGYTLYGPMPDSTKIDVVGGWHDASDYLQYSTTSANATYHLLMAWRDFPSAFIDSKAYNGLDGKNGVPDILDEARWGLDWLLKMHPREDWMFNQIADDRDHMGMRMPKQDTFYGRGFQRPVYFVSGEIQQRGKFKNITTGTSSIAGKFSSAFALGAELFQNEAAYRDRLTAKAFSAYAYAMKKPGFSQTASVRSPYIYEESNWVDDMELAASALASISDKFWVKGSAVKSSDRNNYLTSALGFAKQEPTTPWLGADTARHYQWYPFINLGHYELAKRLEGKKKDTVVAFYKKGIELVWNKAKQNAFYRGVPFIWCSNNLTTSFAIQCYWYRQLTGDNSYSHLEQSNFDWLFGCNPWGTSMVYGLPSWGDNPSDPHSAFTRIGKHRIDGGLVDGPVYGNIYKNLIGITLYQPDEYAEFQSALVVYHDDYGDYSTNEPTMDGTASLIYLLASREGKKPIPVKKKP